MKKKPVLPSPSPARAAPTYDQRYAAFRARDRFSSEVPETLCDVVNRICDRYSFRPRMNAQPNVRFFSGLLGSLLKKGRSFSHSSGRPT